MVKKPRTLNTGALKQRRLKTQIVVAKLGGGGGREVEPIP